MISIHRRISASESFYVTSDTRDKSFGNLVNGGPKFLYHVKQHMSNLQRYLVVGLGLPLTVTIRVSRVGAMVSVRFSGIWDRHLQVCQSFCYLL